MKLLLVIFSSLTILYQGQGSSLYYITASSLKFRSEAPLEIISAESTKMLGVIDNEKKAFAFSVQNSSFEGFNSELQRVHFNENYMESDKFPVSSFKGKIIEDVDFSKPGTYQVRAKGTLSIHGVARERIIKAVLTVTDKGLKLESQFTVLLKDHNIRVPKVVHEKVASEILVEVKSELKKK